MSAETAGSTSLVPYRESVAILEGENRCPRKLGWSLVEVNTGQTFPARCKANLCSFCGPRNAWLVGGAIALAEPQRFFTLTQVGDDWQTIRNRMKQLTFVLRRKFGGELQWCWHVEPNPAGTGHHVHGFQRGPFLPQADLSRLADGQGMGRVADIRRWRSTRDVVSYGVKLAGVEYGLKLAEAGEMINSYLDANGGRLAHASRGFWKDREGQPVGQREAMAAWVKDPTESSGEWVLRYTG